MEFIDTNTFKNIAAGLDIKYVGGRSLLKSLDNEFIISYGEDYNVKSIDIPSNVKFIFSQNVDVKDDRLIPIPIGIPSIDHYPRFNKRSIFEDAMTTDIKPNKLVYLNINPDTNPIRYKVAEIFKNKEWCTTELLGNTRDYKNYVDQIKNHKFVISPEGFGFDCYRTWETLYLGRIPVVSRRVLTEEFSKTLPILVIDNWEEVTEDFLNSKYKEIKYSKTDLSMLKPSYWFDLIKSKIEG